jgi:magnesium transporter
MRERRETYKKPGLPPSTLIGPEGAFVPKSLHVFHYTADSLEEVDVASAAEAAKYKDQEGITWVNVDGLGSSDMIRELGNLFGLHPLAQEDVLSVPQRPKVDDYDSHIFAVIRMLHYEEALETEQVSAFLGSNFVITIQERPGDCLDPVRDRLRKGAGQIRRMGPDCLLHAILDTIIDNYFPFLERVGEAVEDLENDVIRNPSRRTIGRVHDVKRDLLDVRRSIWPLRDAVNTLLRDESPLIDKTTRLYLRDCYDHTIRVLDILEIHREIAGGLMDIYLSSLSNKMNEVMKVLTVIATIFIPLTFIVGVYGMNFEAMPELHWVWGYPLVWVIMLLVALGMLLFFYRKGWLRGENNR